MRIKKNKEEKERGRGKKEKEIGRKWLRKIKREREIKKKKVVMNIVSKKRTRKEKWRENRIVSE